jgi:hypothetical protein
LALPKIWLMMLPVAHPNLSSFVRVRISSSLILPHLLKLCEFPETRKTYRAVFSEPKLVIPGTSVVELAEGDDSVAKSSGEQLSEAKPTAVAQRVSAVTGSPTAQLDGRQPKRARDIAEVADGNTSTVGGARKKRKGNKKSG